MKYALVLFSGLFLSLSAFCQAASSSCGKNCGKCSSSKEEKTSVADTGNGPVIACKLSSPEMQKRKETVIAELKKRCLEKRELPSGYAFRFEDSGEMLDLLTDFIKTEKLCCDFFVFSLHLKGDQAIWMDITGPAGTKDFISSGLGL